MQEHLPPFMAVPYTYETCEAYHNARYWLRELGRAWPKRNAGADCRRWVKNCIEQYRMWCERAMPAEGTTKP